MYQLSTKSSFAARARVTSNAMHFRAGLRGERGDADNAYSRVCSALRNGIHGTIFPRKVELLGQSFGLVFRGGIL